MILNFLVHCRCSREVEVDWAAISECAKGLEGNKLHKEAGDKTSALVPRVSDIIV